jgi:hypothetical protein
MRTQLLAFCVAALAATVSGAPNILSKRAVVNNLKGNVKLVFSDEMIKIGSVQIREIIHELPIACSTSGMCNTSPLTFKGRYVTGKVGTGLEVKVKPSRAYKTWIHNGLIDMLEAAVKKISQCKESYEKIPEGIVG